jgi:hypothetical protein
VYDLTLSATRSARAAVQLPPSPHTECIRTIAFDADSLVCATSGDDKVVAIWETKTWTLLCSLCVLCSKSHSLPHACIGKTSPSHFIHM